MAFYEQNNEAVFDIREKLFAIAKYSNGWQKELNFISWKGWPPKFDIRDWNSDHTKSSKGATLHTEEAKKLREYLSAFDFGRELTKDDEASAADDDFQYAINEHLGILGEYKSGWRKELNIISWNNGAPKFDIRDWGPDHDLISTGITLYKEEAAALLEFLSTLDFKRFLDMENGVSAEEKRLIHPLSGKLGANPQIKTVNTKEGDRVFCNMTIYVRTQNSKKDIPVQITARDEIARELAKYNKGDYIEFTGEAASVTYKPNTHYKEITVLGYNIIHIDHDKVLLGEYNKYIKERFRLEKEIEIDANGLELQKSIEAGKGI